MKKDIIILLGPPASGKGTQSAILSEKLGFCSVSTGSLLRNEAASGSELGKNISKLINNGDLVSDDLMFQVLKAKLDSSDCNGFILDGFPRTKNQAVMLFDFVAGAQFNLKKVIVIKLDKKDVLDRIGTRITCGTCGKIYNSVSSKPKVDGICDNCHSRNLINRNDDLNMEAINKRVDIFDSNIDDIISFYEKKSLIFLIDGLKDVNAINLKIMEALNSN